MEAIGWRFIRESLVMGEDSGKVVCKEGFRLNKFTGGFIKS